MKKKWIVRDNSGSFYVDASTEEDAIVEAKKQADPFGKFTLTALSFVKMQARVEVTDVSTLEKGYVFVNAPNMEDMDLDVADGVQIQEGHYWIGVEGWADNGEIEIGTIIAARPCEEEDEWTETQQLLANEFPKIRFLVEENTHSGGYQVTGDLQMDIARDPYRIRVDVDVKKSTPERPVYRARLYMKVIINKTIEKRDIYETTSKSPMVAAEGLCAQIRAARAFLDRAE